ncbi:HAD-IC family P-type ATPase [Leifsonia sp. NPDC102414]|uniref:HAD-IC family P-type ATPase n=1 Tax=Leifsonia sp. NPDC102414 TaxID=3364124 RepID=UPI0038156C62
MTARQRAARRHHRLASGHACLCPDHRRRRPRGEGRAVDGEVLDGASDVDQATITGEPLPVAKQTGDEVFAGTVNGTGALRVRVERDPADSVIARIVKMVEQASETKAPIQLFIEKIEQRYSIGMVIATLAVFAIPLAFGDELQPALLRAMTFMIVASPCAVVLSTMPPLLSAIANAGRHGVLAKSAVVMERLGQVDAVALDETGTLTEGTPRVTDIHPHRGSGLDENSLLPRRGSRAPQRTPTGPRRRPGRPGTRTRPRRHERLHLHPRRGSHRHDRGPHRPGRLPDTRHPHQRTEHRQHRGGARRPGPHRGRCLPPPAGAGWSTKPVTSAPSAWSGTD